MAGNYDIPTMRLQVAKSSTDELAEARNKLASQIMSRAMSPTNNPLMRQLSLLRTLKSLGFMNGFTDPVSGEFIRTPGQKLTEKQQKEFLEQKHQREAREAVWNNEALFERLRQADSLSAEKRLKNLQSIKKSDIEPIAKQYGVKTADVYRGLFSELEQQYAQQVKTVQESGGLGSLWKEAQIAAGDIWEAGKSLVSDWSDKERLARAEAWNKERQAIIESDPYLADQAKREAEGEGYFTRGSGSTGSYLANAARTAMGVVPYVGAVLGGTAFGGPAGGIAAPFALGAAQGTFGLAQRAAADPNLTQQQREEAISTLPRLATGALTGTMSAIPLNLGKVAGAVVGRGAARQALQTSLPTATKESIAREIPEYMAAQRAAYAAQYPVRNALRQGALTLGEVEAATTGDVIGRNLIYNAATGSETPITEGLGEALAQGAIAAVPFGAARLFQRPVMPEGYRAEGGRGIRKLSVDEYADRIRAQYQKDPADNAAMTSILSAARQDLGNASFEGLIGRVLDRPGMRDISPETVNNWNRMFNVGRREEIRTAGGGRITPDDIIPGDIIREKPAAKIKDQDLTPEKRMMMASQTLLNTRGAFEKYAKKVISEGGDEAEASSTYADNLTVPLNKALERLGAIDDGTTREALNKLEQRILSLPKTPETTGLHNAILEAIRKRRLDVPETTAEKVYGADGREQGTIYSKKFVEEGGPSARPEQPADSVGGDGQAAAARAADADTSVPRGMATDTQGTTATAAGGTPLQDTGAGATAQGRRAGGTEAQDIGARQGTDVQSQAEGTPAAERGADAGPSIREVPGDEAAGAGARKQADKGVRDEDGTEPAKSDGRDLSDDAYIIRQLTSIEQRSPDVEFKRLNDLINMKNDLMFDGAVGGYKGGKSSAAKRQYVAELMEGLYRTALKPDEMLPNQLRWKVSKYLAANKGVNPMSEGMAEGINKLWNNEQGISEREYLLNTLRDPDEQRRSILENVKCQMVIARRAAK